MLRRIHLIFASLALAFAASGITGCASLEPSEIEQIQSTFEDIRDRAEQRLQARLDVEEAKLEAARLQYELTLAEEQAKLLSAADQQAAELQREAAAKAVQELVNRATANDDSRRTPRTMLAMRPGYSAHLVQGYWAQR